jgi:RNA polymerase sigma-70 factor (ECF subfamily)
MEYIQFSDKVLLQLLSTSDEQAFRVIYERYWRELYLSVYQRIKISEVAEEIVQDVFVSLWQKREQSKIEQLRAYLFTAVKYRLIKYIEANVVRQKYVDHTKRQLVEEDYSGEQAFSLHELMKAIEDVIHKMPAKTERVFRLSRFEQCSVREIALSLNLTEKAVEYHITKSLKLLRTSLKDYIVLIAACLILIK